MTTAQAAERLGVTRRRVLAMVRTGRLRAVRHGRDWWIEPRALAAVAQRRPGRPRRPSE